MQPKHRTSLLNSVADGHVEAEDLPQAEEHDEQRDANVAGEADAIHE